MCMHIYIDIDVKHSGQSSSLSIQSLDTETMYGAVSCQYPVCMEQSHVYTYIFTSAYMYIHISV